MISKSSNLAQFHYKSNESNPDHLNWDQGRSTVYQLYATLVAFDVQTEESTDL